jgi:hypothetical protein
MGQLQPEVLLQRIKGGDVGGASAQQLGKAKERSFIIALSREIHRLQALVHEGNPFRAPHGAKAVARINHLRQLAKTHDVTLSGKSVEHPLSRMPELKRKLHKLETERQALASQL